MGFFGFGKKREFIDLTEKPKRQQIDSDVDVDLSSSSTENNVAGGLGFLGSMAGRSSESVSSSVDDSEEFIDVAGDVNEKRRRLAKRIMDMTQKIEDMSNEIYHLKQRIEVLEKKSGAGNY